MELKEGMIVECRNGNRYLLRKVRGELLLSSNTGKAYVLEDLFDNKYLTCIWERKEPKKMTLAQISEALGYEVEVIDNE